MNVDAIIVLIILCVTALLLVLDLLRMDIAAMLCLLALAWTGVLKPLDALSGFSSNAVIAIIAVMIMGRGVARTGMMDHFARLVLKIAGRNPSRIVALVSATIGLIGGFMHNVGTAVLFLPSVLKIAQRENIPASRLVMPIGFAAIVSGTVTMIASSPVILVNDFLAGSSLAAYGLFEITPVGLALLLSMIAFFFVSGQFILPHRKPVEDRESIQKALIRDWKLSNEIWHYRVPEGSSIIGKTLEETGIWGTYGLNILAIAREKSLEYAPWREKKFESRQVLALIGPEASVRQFSMDYALEHKERPGRLEVLGDPAIAGFAEVIVPPRSDIAGKSLREYGFRRRYGVEPLMLYNRGERVRGDFSDQAIVPGDIFIVHGSWDRILELKKSNDFLLITPIEADEKNQSRIWVALTCFVFAIALNIAGLPISISFLSGAVAMILTRVLDVSEAYQAVDWRVVFFLAGLIPLGLAMQATGAAAFLADSVISLVEGSHPILLLAVIAAMATIFSLFISNVGATVVMAPLVINMANASGLDPRPLVLLVAVSTLNSFILPTHQVNALLKTPGGYRNSDYLKAGGGMTVIFLVVAVFAFYFLYL